MKLAITGSSEYGDMPRGEIDAALKKLELEPSMIVLTGFTHGVDEVARQWALNSKNIPFITIPAEYRKAGGSEAAAKRQHALVAKTCDVLLIIKPDKQGGYPLDRAKGIEKFARHLKKQTHTWEV